MTLAFDDFSSSVHTFAFKLFIAAVCELILINCQKPANFSNFTACIRKVENISFQVLSLLNALYLYIREFFVKLLKFAQKSIEATMVFTKSPLVYSGLYKC